MENDETDQPTKQRPAAHAERRLGAGAVRTALRICALACVLVGVAGALLVARTLAGSQESAARASFAATRAQIDSNLRKALQSEHDLATAAGTFFARDPHASVAGLVAWAGWSRVSVRYPALQRLGLLVPVKRSKLSAFAAREGSADGEAETLRILPAAVRREYCLSIAEIGRGAARRTPPGLDYCSLDRRLLASRGSGRTVVRTPAKRPGRWEALTPV